LKEAESVGDPDIAIFFAEQAIQLYTKAVYYELFGDLIRGHRLRELLSLLIRELRKYGFNNLADKVMEFIDSFRRVFNIG
jgi:HEPN domain-containing protein